MLNAGGYIPFSKTMAFVGKGDLHHLLLFLLCIWSSVGRAQVVGDDVTGGYAVYHENNQCGKGRQSMNPKMEWNEGDATSIVHVTLMDASNRIVRDAKVWVNGKMVPFAEHAQGYVKEMEVLGPMVLRIERSGYQTIEQGNLRELPSRIYLLAPKATYCYNGVFKFPCNDNDDKLLVEVAPPIGERLKSESEQIREAEARIKPLLDSLGLQVVYRYDSSHQRSSDIREPVVLLPGAAGTQTVLSPYARYFILRRKVGGKFRGDEIEALKRLRASPLIRMAGPLLCRNADWDYPGMYTGDLFLEFKENSGPMEIEEMLHRQELGVYFKGEGSERWILRAGGKSRRGMNRQLESLREEDCVLRVSPSVVLYDELNLGNGMSVTMDEKNQKPAPAEPGTVLPILGAVIVVGRLDAAAVKLNVDNLRNRGLELDEEATKYWQQKGYPKSLSVFRVDQEKVSLQNDSVIAWLRNERDWVRQVGVFTSEGEFVFDEIIAETAGSISEADRLALEQKHGLKYVSSVPGNVHCFKGPSMAGSEMLEIIQAMQKNPLLKNVRANHLLNIQH